MFHLYATLDRNEKNAPKGKSSLSRLQHMREQRLPLIQQAAKDLFEQKIGDANKRRNYFVPFLSYRGGQKTVF